jgi:hypothetical protein
MRIAHGPPASCVYPRQGRTLEPRTQDCIGTVQTVRWIMLAQVQGIGELEAPSPQLESLECAGFYPVNSSRKSYRPREMRRIPALADS